MRTYAVRLSPSSCWTSDSALATNRFWSRPLPWCFWLSSWWDSSASSKFCCMLMIFLIVSYTLPGLAAALPAGGAAAMTLASDPAAAAGFCALCSLPRFTFANGFRTGEAGRGRTTSFWPLRPWMISTIGLGVVVLGLAVVVVVVVVVGVTFLG
uniref:(northern house mosquito) hypothetical protein n=1 Tax=Culex pipiens TaxID=7175 RepID=A0A8D8CRI8_CULPI